MSYVKNFKGFTKAEEKKVEEVGANPVMEDDAALLTDPGLIAIQTNKRNLEKQLEQVKNQEDAKLAELRKKAAENAANAKVAPVAQPATPAPAAPTA
jgi:hypothetical protein